MRDKIISTACRTPDGIEWSAVRVKGDGPETPERGFIPLEIPDGSIDDALESTQLPSALSETLKGETIVAMRSAEILLRTVELPSTDEEEIAGMIDLQIDKVAPFPLDRLTVSHETLLRKETSSIVLMAAAPRKHVDAIGDFFAEGKVRIQGIDARVLGWLRLLRDAGQLSESNCDVLLLRDGIDFVLVVLSDGLPLLFRHLDVDPDLPEEIVFEIGQALTSLGAEWPIAPPETLHVLSFDEPSPEWTGALALKSGIAVRTGLLSELPALSEGILRRALDGNRIELVPREWLEREQLHRLRRKYFAISGAVLSVWMATLLSFGGIYRYRAHHLARTKKELAAIEPAARKALENRKKLRTLKAYADRSASPLECLLEATRLLPPGDIEFASYSYKKDKGVTLRGSAANDRLPDDYFSKLASSALFARLRNQSQSLNPKTRRSVFSVSLVLPEEDAP